MCIRLIRVITVFLALWCGYAGAQQTLPSEQQAADPFTWQVVQNHSWAPLAFTNKKGEPEGLLVDLWRRIAEQTHQPLDLQLVEWQQSLEQVRNSDSIIHAGMFRSDERQASFDFSLPLFYLRTTLFVRDSLAYRHWLDVTDLHDLEVGVVVDGHEAEFMRNRYPNITLRFYSGKEQLVQGALRGEIQAFVSDYPGATYYLQQHHGMHRFRVLGVLYQQTVHAAVAKGNTELLIKVNQAIASLGPGEIAIMAQKWLHARPAYFSFSWLMPLLLGTVLVAISGWLLVANRRLRQDLVRVSDQLLEQEKQVVLLTRNMSDWIWTLDIKTCFSYVSPSVKKLLGFDAETLLGQKLESVIHHGEVERTRAIISHLVAAAKRGDIEAYKDLTVDLPMLDSLQRIVWTEVAVRIFFDNEGNYTAAQGTSRDITERRRAEDVMRQLAFNDPLTQLPNRRLLSDRLKHALAGCSRHHQFCGVFFLDLDNFKYINDNYGYDNGDALLQQVAQRLSACLRESDTLGRFGGDEFMVVAEFLGADLQEAKEHALRIAIKMLELFDLDFMLRGSPCHLTASVGIILCNNDERSVETLIKQADNAMCQAKSHGRKQFFLGTIDLPG
ncbi:diguanylate cyclase domain-containing protein [Cellvibrio polysaccharolyticus]|uniref:Diguanylate cyclase n=1 Tax=Cellvibrio polysaccharolyticus TaxID=2082724 RepID=A0A928YSC5_9GAMM|nr:diguanylate cyclase [Cellvibrio polysaccharolyticus]MBE8715617.1 diguanylate cyclase [Cellvibrio polysaccharolyticus]